MEDGKITPTTPPISGTLRTSAITLAMSGHRVKPDIAIVPAEVRR
jgi:hypothetical protein